MPACGAGIGVVKYLSVAIIVNALFLTPNRGQLRFNSCAHYTKIMKTAKFNIFRSVFDIFRRREEPVTG